MAKLTGDAMADAAPGLTRVLGGISPIDPAFIQRLANMGVLDCVYAVAVHGFTLDWNLWSIDEWPARIAEIDAVTDQHDWDPEVGVASLRSEEVPAWGGAKTEKLQ